MRTAPHRAIAPLAVALIGVILTIAWTRSLEHARWKRHVFASFAGTATDTFYRAMYWARLYGTARLPDEPLTEQLTQLDRQMYAGIAEIEILDPSLISPAEAVQSTVALALQDLYEADYLASSPYEQMGNVRAFS